MFERETRREKIIEAKQRELRLKARSGKNNEAAGHHTRSKGEGRGEESGLTVGGALAQEAESEFHTSIEEVSKLENFCYHERTKYHSSTKKKKVCF